MTNTNLQSIEHALGTVFAFSTLFAGRHVTFDVILNPNAGAFIYSTKVRSAACNLATFTRNLVGIARDPATFDVVFHHTTHPGHATSVAESLVLEPASDVRVIVSVGGDGTHGEVLSAAARNQRALVEQKGRLWFFRYPCGTGNDGSDADTPSRAARALMGDARPGSTGHVIVRRARGEPLYGFNIASLGLDAYVAWLTNKLRGTFAGDAYKLLADIMTLFFERVVRLQDMTVRWSDVEGPPHVATRRYALCAIGVSGSRTYGDHKPILPGFENVCLIETTGLVRKIRLKSMVYAGTHAQWPEVRMHSASTVRIDYNGRLPFQADGEATWFEPDDFPVVMEVVPESIPVLQLNV